MGGTLQGCSVLITQHHGLFMEMASEHSRRQSSPRGPRESGRHQPELRCCAQETRVAHYGLACLELPRAP